MAPTTSAPNNNSPGWYPDPSGRGQRYWDGHGWTRMRRASPRTTSTGGGAWVGLSGRPRSIAGY